MAYNFTDKNGLLYVITKIKNLLSNCLDKAGDSKENTVTFTSGDSTNPTGWASINLVESGETHASLFRKFSLVVKNMRYLYRMLGSTDISSIGDGTATGAIATLNSNFNSFLNRKFVIPYQTTPHKYINPDGVKIAYSNYVIIKMAVLSGRQYIYFMAYLIIVVQEVNL